MRRYDIKILLILSIIAFALAAPVPVQEKRQPYVDVMHIPKDVRTVLKKRGVGEDELEKFFMTWGKPIESSDTHASSSSAPQVLDHGSTSVAQAPPPNPALSTANPGVYPDANFDWEYWNNAESPPRQGSAKVVPVDGSTSPALSTANPDVEDPGSDFDWDYWNNAESPPRQSSASPKDIGLAPEHQNPGWSTDGEFDWNSGNGDQREDPPGYKPGHNVIDLKPPPPSKYYSEPGSSPTPYSPRPTRIYPDSDPGYVAGSSPPSPAMSHNSYSLSSWSTPPESPGSLKELQYVEFPPSPEVGTPKTPASPDVNEPIEPEGGMVLGPQASPASPFELDHQSSSTSSQPEPVNLLDAIYAAKGKAKVSARRVSGTL